MVAFFRHAQGYVYAVGTTAPLQHETIKKLTWLFDKAELDVNQSLTGDWVGPRKEMVTPWSTNATEITQNMGISGIERIELFYPLTASTPFDRMLQQKYNGLNQDVFTIHHTPEEVVAVHDIKAYSEKEGLALSDEEINYLHAVSKELNRPLTDSEVFGFSQVNSEHCRHKIFNGTFIIDGVEKPTTLFKLIKKTSQENHNFIVSAYKDNVAFIKGPTIEQFAPASPDKPDFFQLKSIDSVISLKAETHNFPTTVEPFNGAATGSGGEIRDRLAGGKGSIPLAGTAVYMTSYSRLQKDRAWEIPFQPRPWLYQSPADILIKASDGASDFGNKFGQPLINGSVLTLEYFEEDKSFGFDKVIMLAGGIGYAKQEDSQKEHVQAEDQIVLLGGDNYRIGMGGGAVSSVNTGEFGNAIELNAIQRSNPEMQKRVMNAIRGLAEMDKNPIVSIHDHGAGGHFNCLSELLEETGGRIYTDNLPKGDPTLSEREMLSNESQERMGLAMKKEDLNLLKRVAERERAPFYAIGEATGDKRLTFAKKNADLKPIDFEVKHLLGSSPKTILTDQTNQTQFQPLSYQPQEWANYLNQVLQVEAVACKDWLTNKVDRSVTGRVATQQTTGAIQLPLNNVGVMALDFNSFKGIATANGHAPAIALLNAEAGSRIAIAKALTNIVFAPLSHGLKGVSLSANWMWPAKQRGENARLYTAVEAVSETAIQLGINIPTGKDSLSMTQKYPDGKVVLSPGTVIISAVAEVSDIRKTISPALEPVENSSILYIDFSSCEKQLGGSSLAQVLGQLGSASPDIADFSYFKKCFDAVQHAITNEWVYAGHDISSGGLITSLLEMCFPTPNIGLQLTTAEKDLTQFLFSENPGVLLQGKDNRLATYLTSLNIVYSTIATITTERTAKVNDETIDIDRARDTWFITSYLFDQQQRSTIHAEQRFEKYKNQPLHYQFPTFFTGKWADVNINPHRTQRSGIVAAIIREKGSNGDREMAYALHTAGFDVKDVHMTDLISGRETLEDVQMIAFVGGFSNSDVLGSAKGWAGAFMYNEKAKQALEKFYARPDTLSLGVCNGCQLMMELGLLYPELKEHHPRMHHNGSGRYESAFVSITIPQNNSVMFSNLAGTQMGVWLAHGEGRFVLPDFSAYQQAATFAFHQYPGNPNDSDFATAALCSHDGRHLAIMPHIERSLFAWNWPHYPAGKTQHDYSPWLHAFINAFEWVQARKK
ncbi:MAG: phosphoribosylformylglycinamidine synthase [Cyclobacteriaceae bacterium]|nr:phosphoribosylformylglycinamidine synthase [Cytophagales bacterium]MCZ8326522.1 phosphoribosylformylglycinamidine synthase [Cyclobacteriaceae bacterium]